VQFLAPTATALARPNPYAKCSQ